MILNDIRVLDFGRYIAAPVCASLLADLGAEVIRVDRVDGSEDRYLMPVSDTGDGSVYLHANRNKLGMTLDPVKPEGRKIVRQLVERADIVVVNLPESTLGDMGLDYETLKAYRSDIILTSISGFGNTGPYAERIGFDIIGQAMSGTMHLKGEPGNPTRCFTAYVDFVTALTAAYGTLAAIMHRMQTGEGQVVSANLLRSGVNMAQIFNIEQYVTGLNRQATGNRGQYGGPVDLCRTKDGAVVIHVIGNPLFKRWANLVDRADLLNDPRFKSDADRAKNGEVLSEIAKAWCVQYRTDEAIALMEEARVPCSPVLKPGEILRDPHVLQAEMISFHDYPGIDRPVPLAESPFELSAVETTIRRRPPLNGEHTDEILNSLGYDAVQISQLRKKRVV